ncbi:hypothetical protein IC235_03205 [Hymenobacter sp. BT664]|uniref:Uncharacterized protein n=2 Tax=Hymenobacter montanus TaxID=2771359 RepID=A0A927GHY6_9BACT|nr:hypothetical protein [Hymenobacter montanus]
MLLLAFYGSLFLVFTWPLALDFSSSLLVAPGRESYQFLWNVWHFRQAVLSGHNPYYTDWLFYPHGSGLVMHTYTPIIGLLSVVLGDDMLALNTTLLLSYALSGAGAYLLTRRWVRSPLLCLLSGFIFAYAPYKMQRLPEHYNLVLTATVPFYVLMFLRAFVFREGLFLPLVRSWRAVALCLLLGIITLLSDYYVLFGLIHFSLIYAAWFWFRIGHIQWRRPRPWLYLVGILVGSHILIRLMHLAGLKDNGIWWGGDVVSYLMPPPTSHFVHWEWVERLHHNPQVFNMPDSLENTIFIGYALPLLALLLWGLRVVRRRPVSWRFQDLQGRPLAWVLVIFLMFTVPALRIYGHDRLNLPTAFQHFIPFVNNIRCPTRWIMMIGLFLPIITFSALEAAWRDRWSTLSQHALSLLLAAIVMIEFWPKPYQRASVTMVPPVFEEVAKLPGTTLVPIPLSILDGSRLVGAVEFEQPFYQTFHHKKLPIGSLSRVSPELFASLDQEPVLHALLSIQTKPDTVPPAQPSPRQVQRFLRTFDPAAFVISPPYRNQPVHAYLRQLLQPYHYREQLVGGYVLLTPPIR